MTGRNHSSAAPIYMNTNYTNG